MKNKFDRGFTLVEGLLTILIISGVALIGFYVYRQNNHPNESTITSFSSPKPAVYSSVSTKQASTQNYKSWNSVTAADGSYTVKYPKGWMVKKCDQNTLLMGPDDISAGKCNSDSLAQIMITKTDGDKRSDYELKAQDYPDLNNSEVSTAGIKGYLQDGTLQTVSDNFLGPVNGTKTKQYIFVKDNETYIFTYQQPPEYSDKTTYFDQMVTKTLQF